MSGGYAVVETFKDEVMFVDECAFVVARVDGVAGFLAWVPYKKKFLAAAEEAVPPGGIRYIKPMRAWFVDADSARAFNTVVEAMYGVDLQSIADEDRRRREGSDAQGQEEES